MDREIVSRLTVTVFKDGEAVVSTEGLITKEYFELVTQTFEKARHLYPEYGPPFYPVKVETVSKSSP